MRKLMLILCLGFLAAPLFSANVTVTNKYGAQIWASCDPAVQAVSAPLGTASARLALMRMPTNTASATNVFYADMLQVLCSAGAYSGVTGYILGTTFTNSALSSNFATLGFTTNTAWRIGGKYGSVGTALCPTPSGFVSNVGWLTNGTPIVIIGGTPTYYLINPVMVLGKTNVPSAWVRASDVQ
jgi:hypothetical protein